MQVTFYSSPHTTHHLLKHSHLRGSNNHAATDLSREDLVRGLRDIHKEAPRAIMIILSVHDLLNLLLLFSPSLCDARPREGPTKQAALQSLEPVKDMSMMARPTICPDMILGPSSPAASSRECMLITCSIWDFGRPILLNSFHVSMRTSMGA